MKYTLRQIESRLVELKELKNNWQEMSFLLNYCQKEELFKKEHDKFTYWLNSLKDRGLSRSTLIRIKSAGEGWLNILGSSNLNKIESCPIKDSMILTKYLSLKNSGNISYQRLKSIENKLKTNDISRKEIEALLEPSDSILVKSKVKELKDLVKEHPNNKKLNVLLDSFQDYLN
ncbi:hypothetical protein N9948_00260 [bacterium]|nr:hypothetical protein [bacterium]